MTEFLTTLTTAAAQVAGTADGLTFGTLTALETRLRADFGKHELADRVKALHDAHVKAVSEAAANTPQYQTYLASWMTSYAAAYRRFNIPLTAEQAKDVWNTVAGNLRRSLESQQQAA